MAGTDKQKQSLYFTEEMLQEIMRESTRLDRSLSWTVQHAWRLARDEVRKFSSVDHRDGAKAAPRPAPAERPASASVSAPASRPAASRDDGDRALQGHPSSQVREFLRNKFDREFAG